MVTVLPGTYSTLLNTLYLYKIKEDICLITHHCEISKNSCFVIIFSDVSILPIIAWICGKSGKYALTALGAELNVLFVLFLY